MDAIEAILTRRSIRKYTAEPIAADQIDKLLRAAMRAPSAGNEQPWHYIVVEDKKILAQVPAFHPYAAMITEAPAAIVVCGDSSIGLGDAFWIQDCSAATQNILLAAHALGLGAVWLAVYPIQSRLDGAGKLFNLPANIIPLCIVALGHPAEPKPSKDRFDPVKVHRNTW